MNTKYLEIIKAPIVTEKSARLAQEENKYLFKVKVEEISTLNIKTKKRRVGRYAGVSNRAKKAIVKLAEGQTIDLG